MGSWNFKNIGISGNNNAKIYIKQIFTCFSIDCDDDIFGSEAGEISGMFNPEIIANAENAQITALELYRLLNQLFGKTSVFYEEEIGSNTSDYYYRREEIYTPATGRVTIGLRDYCYGDGTAFGRPVDDWDDISRLGTKLSTKKIAEGSIKSKTKKLLLSKAEENGYSELLELATEKLK